MHEFNPRDPGTFRVLWRFPHLVFPALCGAAVQGVADTVFRGASAVAAGDSGIVLFLRVLACVVSVVLPACVWACAAILTTLLAADAWDGARIERDAALRMLRATLRERRAALVAIAAAYVVFLSLGVIVGHVADAIFAATLYFALFALPAVVVDDRPALASLRASYELGRAHPLYVAAALVLPAVVLFVAAALAAISFGVAFFGPIAAGLIAAFAFAFAVTHVCGVYLEAVRACEPETTALGPPPPEPQEPTDVIDAEYIRTHYPPYS